MIEATADKHKAFAKQLEERDSEIFMNIPALLILKSLENEDKDLCQMFYPEMFEVTNEKCMLVVDLK